MNQHEILSKVVEILDEVNVGILATAGKNGRPSVRWMVPAILRARPNALFALTTPEKGKFIAENCSPDVTWMIQTVALDKVITLRGKMNVIDNPSLKMEVLTVVGKKLHNFWKLESSPKDFVVLETVLEEGSYYVPLKGKTEHIVFEQR